MIIAKFMLDTGGVVSYNTSLESKCYGGFMISKSNPMTPKLFDPWDTLGPKRRKMLDTSWAGLFQTQVLPKLPVEKLAESFRSDFGRPSKGLHTAMGVLVLQQMLDTTDEETINQLAFNEMWHFALNIIDQSDAAMTMSLRTLWTLRQKAIKMKLDEMMFNIITDELVDIFSVNPAKQRLDSVHVKSNMARLGRIRLFARTITGFLHQLKRNGTTMVGLVPPEIMAKYGKGKSDGVFSMVKPTESESTLAKMTQDLKDLHDLFSNIESVASMKSFKLLARVLQEQCLVVKTENEESVTVRPAREVPSDSLQNPSDPDAAYSGHKGQGYTAQIMETYDNVEGCPNLILHVAVSPANTGDSGALVPAIADVSSRGSAMEKLLADAAYGGDANVQSALDVGVTVVSPVLGQPEASELTLADFSYTTDGAMVACPAGQLPISEKKSEAGISTVRFEASCCETCPQRDCCPAKPGKKFYTVSYTDSSRRASQRRVYEKTAEFREDYRFRSGVEATMSQLDRKTGIKKLRVRGLKAVKFCVFLKALGVNILRATAARRITSGNQSSAPVFNPATALNTAFWFTAMTIVKLAKKIFRKISPYRKLIFAH